MGKRDKRFNESAALNNGTYRFYYDRLTELALSVFEWVNLPPTVDPRFLELSLFTTGQAVFFEDEVLGYLALKNAGGGPMNVYDVPVRRRAYGNNGYQRPLTEEDSVIIYNNYLRTPDERAVSLFARRLYNLDRAIDVNANAQKTPVLILCDETERLSMLNLYQQFDGNEPFIFGSKGLNPKGLSVLNTGAPLVAPQLYDLKSKIWNEALTYIGISNVTYNKRERLISSEVEREQGGIVASRYSKLAARRQACDQINAMFGLDIWCNFRGESEESGAFPQDEVPEDE